jgi:hypothetical protein
MVQRITIGAGHVIQRSHIASGHYGSDLRLGDLEGNVALPVPQCKRLRWHDGSFSPAGLQAWLLIITPASKYV